MLLLGTMFAMRIAFAVILVLAVSSPALAHEYRIGDLEIIHPAIMVPSAKSDCTCAHLKIVNHGVRSEYLLGAVISVANNTHLIEITGHGLTMPQRVEIPPGEAIDLSHHAGCLFMSGIKARLEADFGAVPAQLHFEYQDTINIEFMVDDAGH